MIAGDAVHKGGSDDDGALQIPCQMLVGIAEEQGSDMKVNADFLAEACKHLVDRIGCLGRRVDLLTRGSGRDRTSIIEKIKGVGISLVDRADFVRALDGNKTLGNHGDKLAGRARHLEDTIRVKGETLCLREGGAHSFEKSEGIGIQAGRCLGMESTGRYQEEGAQGEEGQYFHSEVNPSVMLLEP